MGLHRWYTTLLILLVDALPCFLSAYALKVTRFNVPSEMLTTHPGQLICEFEISRGERLYSLRWYLNDIEFFRFEPRADQRVQLFPLPQLRLDLRQPTNGSVLRVQRLTTAATGLYKCEVLADSSFKMVQREQYMRVLSSASLKSATSQRLLTVTLGFATVLLNCNLLRRLII